MVGVTEDRALWIARNVLPHEPALRAQIARWRLPLGLDADDVVQEAYSRFASLDSVEDIRNPRNYLYMIARNVMTSHARHARVVSILGADDLDSFGVDSDEPSPETVASDREQLQMLAVAVSELPEPSRKAFLMRVIEEMSHRAIGEKLGMSENAVQKNIAKSLGLLMARLGRGGNAVSGASSNHRKQGSEQIRDGRSRDERGD